MLRRRTQGTDIVLPLAEDPSRTLRIRCEVRPDKTQALLPSSHQQRRRCPRLTRRARGLYLHQGALCAPNRGSRTYSYARTCGRGLGAPENVRAA